ncbi:hypothetical protein V1511DRAFT_494698 [Dipodascopsis uninucleata]
MPAPKPIPIARLSSIRGRRAMIPIRYTSVNENIQEDKEKTKDKDAPVEKSNNAESNASNINDGKKPTSDPENASTIKAATNDDSNNDAENVSRTVDRVQVINDSPKLASVTPSSPRSTTPNNFQVSHRGRRERSVTPEDSEDRVIDVDKVTMAELCRDIHIGRKSTVYDKLEQLRQKEKTRKRNALYETDEEKLERKKRQEALEVEAKKRAAKLVEKGVDSGMPRLRVVDDKIIVDEESLQVDRHERDAQDVSPEDVENIDEYSRRVNSASWSKRERVERWNAVETKRFYDALSMWGTDFGLMAQMFPGRSRRQIKNKFNSEERKYPAKVHLALSRRIPVSAEYLQK